MITKIMSSIVRYFIIATIIRIFGYSNYGSDSSSRFFVESVCSIGVFEQGSV